MFTGLVQGVGHVLSIGPHPERPGVTRLVLDPRWDVAPRTPLEPGESISISGVCLTLVDPAPSQPLRFDLVQETLDRTALGRLAPGRRVNLERSLTANDFMGGHVVQGHIDGTGRVTRVQRGDDWRLWIAPGAGPAGEDLMQYIVPKGSVCVEGVSLTVAGVHAHDHNHPHNHSTTPRTFHVALIPTTLAKTTLADLAEGDAVNLETDAMARTIVHWLRHYGPGLGGRGTTP